MNNEDIAVTLAEHGKEIGSLKHRVNNLEEINGTIQELVLSVRELAVNMANMLKEQERQAKCIDTLEAQPAKRWDTVTTVVITAIASGIITYVMTNIFH